LQYYSQNAREPGLMGETLNLLFKRRENGTFELQAQESWSGHTVAGDFIPPYTTRLLNLLLKKLNSLDMDDQELRDIGLRLFSALCGTDITKTKSSASSAQSVCSVLRGTIQRTIKRRGTVALTLCFGPGCDEFVRYPWELLHNGDYFLLASGIFTLSRALLRPDLPVGCELPVHLPMRVLYISASPSDCAPLETERSYEALEQALTPLLDAGQVFLDRLEPPTFDQLVRYFNSYGGVGTLDDNDTTIPCYVIHFDGHGAFGRLCPDDECETVNEAEARKCEQCGTSLARVKPQTYLCFCDDEGRNHFVNAQALRELFVSSDLRLAVFSACETATITAQGTSRSGTAVDATLATALVTAQVPYVVAMPFSLQDDLSPTFVYHFYEALADGRTLEEALSRARQALLSKQQKSWFVPVLYRHVSEGFDSPAPLLANDDIPTESEHPLSYLGPSSSFVGRQQELQDLDEFFTTAMSGEQARNVAGHLRLRPGTHHIALTGSPGIGKSALAFEAVRRNRYKFPGGIIGASLQDGKPFSDAMLEIMLRLRIPLKNVPAKADQRARLVLSTLRSLASRELPCLFLLDSFEEVKDRSELETWLQFLSALPQEVVVVVTSRSNPETMMIHGGPRSRWYEYRVGKMTEDDLLSLFNDLASSNGLDQQIHLDRSEQQSILHEICTLLDGYPLGAELIFGTARSIDGKVYTPEAATRSLEEIRDELQNTPLAGILAVLEISYQHISPLARLLLAYLATFKLPFSREQIMMLVTSEALVSATETVHLGHNGTELHPQGQTLVLAQYSEDVVPADLAKNWRSARDELVQASFMQFDGHVYTIHPQIRHFALSHLPIEERSRIHRVVAAHYYQQPQPRPDEWFAAFEHLENAGEPQDLQEAVRVAVKASWALIGHGYAPELLAMLRRAGGHASRLRDRTGEGQVECCLGAILRQQGQYTDAEACLRSSLTFHRQQNEPVEEAWAMYELAMLFSETGNLSEASSFALDAHALFHDAGHSSGEAWIHIVLGEIDRKYGRYHDALSHYELAMAGFRSLGEREGCAWVLTGRAAVYEVQGKYTRALNDYEEAEQLFNKLDMCSSMAWTLLGKCVVYNAQSKLEQAEKAGNAAIASFKAQSVRRGEARALYAQGNILQTRQEVIQARGCYEAALSLFSTIGVRIDQAYVLYALGSLFFQEGEHMEARDKYEQALAIAQAQGERYLEGQTGLGLGNVAFALRRYIEAERYYRAALTIATELEIPAEHYQALCQLGLLYVARRRCDKGLDLLVQALALGQSFDHLLSTDLPEKVRQLVTEQHLEDSYAALCEQYGLV
jgi:tetratricopeptide (TPR) repeat protein